ncbi:MAG: ATP-binding cassette domain-containing protein [Brevinema sp.]
MITINNFSLIFPNFSLLIPSLALPNKGLVFLHGTNGSGKSSLFRAIVGLHTQYQGEILIDHSSTLSPQQIIKKISYLPQISTTLPAITGEEFIRQGLYLPGQDQSSDLISRLRADNLRNKMCNTMSGGEKQLLTIIRNLALKKNILILDEPDSFLSKSNKTLLSQLISDLAQEHLVFMSSHQAELYHAHQVFSLIEVSDYHFILEQN